MKSVPPCGKGGLSNNVKQRPTRYRKVVQTSTLLLGIGGLSFTFFHWPKTVNWKLRSQSLYSKRLFTAVFFLPRVIAQIDVDPPGETAARDHRMCQVGGESC